MMPFAAGLLGISPSPSLVQLIVLVPVFTPLHEAGGNLINGYCAPAVLNARARGVIAL